VLSLLVVSVTINYLDRGALSVAAPLLTRELDLSAAQMGLLLSSFFWTYATFQLVAGWLVDRFPVKWVYAIGYLVWSLATAAVGIASGLPELLLARFVLGMGESVAYPACSKIIVTAFKESQRGTANALVDAGSKVGPGLSTMLGGLAIAAYGWRGLFAVSGVWCGWRLGCGRRRRRNRPPTRRPGRVGWRCWERARCGPHRLACSPTVTRTTSCSHGCRVI